MLWTWVEDMPQPGAGFFDGAHEGASRESGALRLPAELAVECFCG